MMMRRVFAIAGSVVADSARRKVMYAVLALAAVMMLAIPSLPSYGVGVITGVFREVSLAVMYAMAVLVVLVLCANRIPGEVERRTVYNVLSKPVARWQYLLGTWLGIWAVMGMLLVAFLAVDLVLGAVVYHEFMWRLAEGAFGIWLESGVVAAAATALSTRFGPVTVALGSLVLLFVAHSKGGLFGENPQGMVASLYPSLDVFTVINPVAHGSGVGPAYMGLMVLAFVGWSAVLMGLGVLAFQGRDL
jgi:ABC-type transport system involved in multi-copper enzyme maturation permease subunit